jgi:excisionase family DNA binding protein
MTEAERRAKLRAAVDLLADTQAVILDLLADSPIPASTSAPPPASLLDPDEVKTRLRMSRSAVYRLARSGELPARKVLSSWRFEPEDVEAYIRRHANGIGPT